MTHIAGHPPAAEESTFSASPFYKMFGYVKLGTHHHDHHHGAVQQAAQHVAEEEEDFRILFFNNTGYVFNKDEAIGFHIALFPLVHKGALAKTKKQYCALAYDLVPFEFHHKAEEKFRSKSGKKIEELDVAYVRSSIEDKAFGFNDEEKHVLKQSCDYLASSTFNLLRDSYKTEQVDRWIRKNVATLEETKAMIFGCGSAVGNTLIDAKEFSQIVGRTLVSNGK